MKLILDIDKTLIDNIYINNNFDDICIKERPYLKEFFIYIFDNFDSVSIWTAGTREWYCRCYSEVFIKYIPIDKCFDFVITREDGFIIDDYGYPKILKKIYDVYNDYNKDNSFILDDNKITHKINKQNAVYIKPFFYGEDNNDYELKRLILYFENLI